MFDYFQKSSFISGNTNYNRPVKIKSTEDEPKTPGSVMELDISESCGAPALVFLF